MPMTITTSAHIHDDTVIEARPAGTPGTITVHLHEANGLGPDAYVYVPTDRIDELCAALVAAHAASAAARIPDSLRTIARRQGFTLEVVDNEDMPFEAYRTGQRLLAMNFADLEHLTAWLDGNDAAAALATSEHP